jgi:hypothetical protein
LLTLLTRRVLLSLEVPPSPSGRLSSATRTVEMWHHEELGQCAQYGHEGLVGRGSRPDGSDRWAPGSTGRDVDTAAGDHRHSGERGDEPRRVGPLRLKRRPGSRLLQLPRGRRDAGGTGRRRRRRRRNGTCHGAHGMEPPYQLRTTARRGHSPTDRRNHPRSGGDEPDCAEVCSGGHHGEDMPHLVVREHRRLQTRPGLGEPARTEDVQRARDEVQNCRRRAEPDP